MARVGDDKDLLMELVGLFLEEAPAQIENLMLAFESGDVAVAERLAHSLKGASSNLSAEKMRLAAYQIEKTSREEGLQQAKDLIENLKAEFQRLKTALSVPPDSLGKVETAQSDVR